MAGQAPAGIPGAGGSEGAAGEVDGGQEQGQEPEANPAAQWQESVDTRLDGALNEIRQMAQLVDQRTAPPPEPQQSFEEQFNALIENSPGGMIDPNQLGQLIQDSNQKAVQEALAPFQAQMQQFQQAMTRQEFVGLQNEFPELKDPKTTESLADAAVDEVIAIGVPDQIAEGLMQNPRFARLVHLAKKAEAVAQGETSVGQGQQAVPQLETGGGAAPATGGGDEWDRIANTGRAAGGSIW